MRVVPVSLACCAAFLVVTITDAQAEVEKPTAELTVFPKKYALSIDKPPTMLRGDATRRGTVDGRLGETYLPESLNVNVGDKLWLTNPFTGQAIICDVARPHQAGTTFIGCLDNEPPFVIDE